MAVVMEYDHPTGAHIRILDDGYAGISEEEKQRREAYLARVIDDIYTAKERRIAEHMREGTVTERDREYLHRIGVREENGEWVFPAPANRRIPVVAKGEAGI